MPVQNAVNARNLLGELSTLVSSIPIPKDLFVDWRELLGFRLGWLKPRLEQMLCNRHGLVADDCEIIMMQAFGLTECHLHQNGATTFMALGEEHGFPNPSGGTLFGEFREGQLEFTLTPQPARAGEVFEVEAGRIHAFYANDFGNLTAIGVVSPRIRHGERFDVVPFTFVRTNPYVVRKEQEITGGGWQDGQPS